MLFRSTKWCRSQKTDEDEAVTLMTMHGSKGLEYEVVFVIDVVEGVMPHHMSVRPEEIEEERRMFYVAMTRAKNKLHLYHVKNRYNQDCEPSRFLSELRD